MTERQDAEVTQLVCFSTPRHDGQSSFDVCLGFLDLDSASIRRAATGDVQRKFFIRVNVSGLKVTVPSSIPGMAPSSGAVNVSETMPLSSNDVTVLRAWLEGFGPRDTEGLP